LSFHDVVEIFNPLEHLPVISTIYQAVTGDKPSTGQRIVGDTLYGGPIGFLAAVVQTMADGAAKLIEGKGEAAPSPPTAVASASPAVPAEAADSIETGGKALSLGLTPDSTLPNGTVSANPPTAKPAASLAAADPGSAVFGPASSNPADPGSISGPLTDTGNAATLPAKGVPVPLPPPDAAGAEAARDAATPGNKAVAMNHKTVFMPLPKRSTHFFPLNNAAGKKTFYSVNSSGANSANAMTPDNATSSAASAAKTPQAPSQTTSSATSDMPVSVTPSAIAAALAPAIDAPQLPSFASADSLSDPLAPSLSSAALATTEAASDKYNQALDLAQKLKFFYGGATPGGGPSP
jgi:hypothetical protein